MLHLTCEPWKTDKNSMRNNSGVNRVGEPENFAYAPTRIELKLSQSLTIPEQANLLRKFHCKIIHLGETELKIKQTNLK